jgi:cytochrome P450
VDWIVPRHQPPTWTLSQRAWTVTRYEDTATVLRHPGVAVADVGQAIDRLGRRAGRPYTSLVNVLRGVLIFLNPPFHARARSFAKRALGAMTDGFRAEKVQSIVGMIMTAALERGRVDAVSEICGRLPVLVMADAMDLPVQCVDFVYASGGSLLSAGEPGLPLRVIAAIDDAARALDELIRCEIQSASRCPSRRLNLILAINDAEFGFTDDELVACLVFLLIAGVETTSGLLGSAILMMLLHPDETCRLRDEPQSMAAFLDEVLRIAGPIRRLSGRITSVPLQLSDVLIAPGSAIVVDVEQAHHDPSAYESPSHLDLDRHGPPSFAFGAGGHACLGATIARLQASQLLRALLSCNVTLLDRVPAWDDNPRMRRLKSLNLLIQPG